jgi:hypothetical protein
MHDPVNHPKHYTAHPSGIECIQITEHMGFNLGNAMKYVWRADLKHDAVEDLRKAMWYIQREIEKRINPSEVRKDSMQHYSGTAFAVDAGAGTSFDWSFFADKECGK